MSYLISETIKDSISIYLRKEEVVTRSDSIRWDFGQFEYLSTAKNGVFFNDSAFEISHFLISERVEGALIAFPLHIRSIFFIIFLLCFAVFSFIYSRERTALKGNFNTITSLRTRSLTAYKEQVTTAELWGEFFMIFQTILLFSIILFTYIWGSDFSMLTARSFAVNFLLILLLLSVLAGLKFLIYKFISLFFLHNDINNWINRYYRLLELVGVALFIPTILYIFIPEMREVMQMIILFIIIMSRLIVVIELLNIFVKNKVGGFYFFSYLCGTEIAPYLIYYKGVVLLISIAGNNIL